MRKWIIAIIVIILVGGGGTYWYHDKKAKAQASASNVIIPTATVQRGTLESDVTGSGSLSPTIDEDIQATSQQTVYNVLVKVGQTVKKGQNLLEYNNGTYATAPAAGTITAVSVYNTSNVQPGSVLCHLTSYQNLNTVISVDELDIPTVKKGQSVNVSVNAYPDQKFTGKVTAIADTGTDSNGVSSFDVTVHLDQSKNLKPGMTTSASIVTNQKTNTLYVPVSAIHKQGSETYVLVQTGSSSSSQSGQSSQSSSSKQNARTNGRSQYGGGQWQRASSSANTQQVAVKTGINNNNDIEILSGLQEGQIVQLPPIVKSSGTTSGSTGSGGFGGMYGGGMGGFGGGYGGGSGGFSRRSFSGGGSSSNSSHTSSGSGGGN